MRSKRSLHRKNRTLSLHSKQLLLCSTIVCVAPTVNVTSLAYSVGSRVYVHSLCRFWQVPSLVFPHCRSGHMLVDDVRYSDKEEHNDFAGNASEGNCA